MAKRRSDLVWFRHNSGWKLLVDQMQTGDTDKERTDAVQNAVFRGRFLRVTILGTPANRSPALAELEVSRILTAQ